MSTLRNQKITCTVFPVKYFVHKSEVDRSVTAGCTALHRVWEEKNAQMTTSWLILTMQHVCDLGTHSAGNPQNIIHPNEQTFWCKWLCFCFNWFVFDRFGRCLHELNALKSLIWPPWFGFWIWFCVHLYLIKVGSFPHFVLSLMPPQVQKHFCDSLQVPRVLFVGHWFVTHDMTSISDNDRMEVPLTSSDLEK